MKRVMGIAAAIGLTMLISSCGRFNCGLCEGWGQMMVPGWGGMFMGMILLIVLVVAALWWLTKGGGGKQQGPLPVESPLDILKRRYAAGEITKEQFEGMKKDLSA